MGAAPLVKRQRHACSRRVAASGARRAHRRPVGFQFGSTRPRRRCDLNQSASPSDSDSGGRVSGRRPPPRRRHDSIVHATSRNSPRLIAIQAARRRRRRCRRVSRLRKVARRSLRSDGAPRYRLASSTADKRKLERQLIANVLRGRNESRNSPRASLFIAAADRSIVFSYAAALQPARRTKGAKSIKQNLEKNANDGRRRRKACRRRRRQRKIENFKRRPPPTFDASAQRVARDGRRRAADAPPFFKNARFVAPTAQKRRVVSI